MVGGEEVLEPPLAAGHDVLLGAADERPLLLGDEDGGAAAEGSQAATEGDKTNKYCKCTAVPIGPIAYFSLFKS